MASEKEVVKTEEEKKFADLPIIGKQPESEREEKYLREIVEFEFYNTEEPGREMTFSYGDGKHKVNLTLHHSKRYKMPRFLARHIESRSTPIYDWRPDGSGKMVKTLMGNKPRFQMRAVFV